MAAAHSALAGWIESHEADSRKRDMPFNSGNTSDAKMQQQKQSRSWER
jgi:hypothetical protein